jgi:hypothetical protein
MIINTPPLFIWVGFCARAASGHVAAAPPISMMNSRRFIDNQPPLFSVGSLSNFPVGVHGQMYEMGQSRRFLTSAIGPVYPRTRTSPDAVVTSHLCHKRSFLSRSLN